MYDLVMPVISMIGVEAWSSADPRRHLLDLQVEQHRQQQHEPEEEPEPVRIPTGVDDALHGHAVDERADGGPDRPIRTRR